MQEPEATIERKPAAKSAVEAFPPFMDVETTARFLCSTEKSVRHLIQRGVIPTSRLTERKILVDRELLVRVLKAKTA